MRQGRRRDQRTVGDAHAVVHLVFFLDTAQDRDRVLDRRLADIDWLEAAFERGVLLDVLAIFVQCRRADAMELAARQGRLQHVGGVHRAFRLAGADQGVQLVDEDDDLAGRGGDLGQHRLQPLLELAAVFGAGDHRAEVERQEALFLQALRHVAIDDAQGQPLDNRGLADPGLADQYRIVLRAPRQDLDRAADLLVAADHRVELALARRFGQVARVFLQGVIAFLGRGGVRLAALAHLFDRGVEVLRRHMPGRERLAGRRVRCHRQCQQQPLDRDIAVAGFLGDLLGLVENPRQFGRQIDLAGPAALDLGLLVELGIDREQYRLRIAAGGTDQIGAEAFLVFEQGFEEMFRRQPLMAAAQREVLGRLDKALRPLGVFFELHGYASCEPAAAPPEAATAAFHPSIWGQR